jgi:hypothetical protein
VHRPAIHRQAGGHQAVASRLRLHRSNRALATGTRHARRHASRGLDQPATIYAQKATEHCHCRASPAWRAVGDRRPREEAGVRVDTRITKETSGVSLRSLRHVLNELMTFVVRNDAAVF